MSSVVGANPRHRRLFVKGSLTIAAIFVYAVLIICGAWFNKAHRKFNSSVTTLYSSKFNKSAAYPVPREYFPDADVKFCQEHNLVHLSAKVSAIMPLKNAFSLTLSVVPCGDFASFQSARSGNPILTQTMNLTVEKDPVILFEEGDYNLYPLDMYDTGIVPITGVYKNVLDNNNSYPIPMALTMQGSIQGFHTKIALLEDASNTFNYATHSYVNTGDGTIIAFRLIFTRAWTTLFFAGLIMIITWTLPLMVFVLSVTLLARGRAVEPPTIMFFVNLLFTLPAIRRAQPSIPRDPGCLSDMVSFFWAITLQSISAILMLINYIHKYRQPNVGLAPTPMETGGNDDVNAVIVIGNDNLDNLAMNSSYSQLGEGGIVGNSDGGNV
ncbi:hypothetical protein DFJ73DRAFT_845966 [Zopfochytrium polystomum]|nr:hypothetical protein DFJ73DRAFT_845966 [Zopfochytrium polystomum]